MQIDRSLVLHVARLARLRLTDEEVGYYTGTLGRILEYIKIINEIDDSESVGMGNQDIPATPLRPDQARTSEASAKTLAGAPEVSGSSFVVPRIIES